MAKAALKKLPLIPLLLIKLARNKLVLFLLVLVVLVGLVYLGRGWIRKTAEPKAVAVTSGRSVKSEAEKQLSALGDPMARLGYPNEKKTFNCFMATARSIHTEVTCTYVIDVYAKVSDLKDNPNLNTEAAGIEKSLKANGWDGTYGLGASPYTSLTRLAKSLTSGIDYQPDAAYAKNIGKITCFFDSHTAYSHPAPAAIGSSYICSRTYDVFGSTFKQTVNQ
ncbi:MAG TPA: hypothetical protein VG964_02075 [Candidatus Saccharimonadales bacterium]|nr:hypothetical protein [Candidatus Saccharimonadales bacterium]